MTQQNFAIFRIFDTQYFIMWRNFLLWSTYWCAHPNKTDSESAGYFNDNRKVEHGKYFLGTDSALSDIFENRKPQSLWWAEKNLIKTIGNLVQKYYNNGHIFIYFPFKLCGGFTFAVSIKSPQVLYFKFEQTECTLIMKTSVSLLPPRLWRRKSAKFCVKIFQATKRSEE